MTKYTVRDLHVTEEPGHVTIEYTWTGADLSINNERIVIRSAIEAEAIARSLERVFGANMFKVIKQRSQSLGSVGSVAG